MSLTDAEIRIVIIGTMLAMFLSALDQTIVATALPSIGRDLGHFELISWVVTAYLLTSTCVTPVLGKLSDRFGRRPIMTLCIIVFLGASVLSALSPSMLALIVARGLQGVGGGGLITLAQAIIADVVSPRERGRYAAYFAGVWAMAGLLGPSLGGFLTAHAGWPWIFWINLPIGLIGLAISHHALGKLGVHGQRAPIDYAGILYLCLATVALLTVLSLGGTVLPWTAPATIALGVGAVVLGWLFWRRQLAAPDPVLPPRFLANPVVAPALTAIFLVFGAYLAVAVLAPVFLQVALGVPVEEAGLLMIPLMISTTITAGIAGRYSRVSGRYKTQPLLGLPVAIAALGVLAAEAGNLAPWAAAAVLTVVGLGVGPIFPCAVVAVQNAVARHDLGAVSGALGFVRALGGAIATAAGSALVLGLAALALPGKGAASLEELTRLSLPPATHAGIAHAFAALFAALAVTVLAGLLVYWRVEDRTLSDQTAVAPAPTLE